MERSFSFNNKVRYIAIRDYESEGKGDFTLKELKRFKELKDKLNKEDRGYKAVMFMNIVSTQVTSLISNNMKIDDGYLDKSYSTALELANKGDRDLFLDYLIPIVA